MVKIKEKMVEVDFGCPHGKVASLKMCTMGRYMYICSVRAVGTRVAGMAAATPIFERFTNACHTNIWDKFWRFTITCHTNILELPTAL